MVQIVKSNNNYYIYDGYDFYGSFHSIAEVENNIKSYKKNPRLLTKPLKSYTFIKNFSY
jgi:hypothetical protein